MTGSQRAGAPKTDAQIGDLKDQLDRQNALVRRVAATMLFMVALAVAIVPFAVGLVSGGWGWVLVIAAAGGLAFLALWLLVSWKKAAAIAGIVIAGLAMASNLYIAAPKDEKPEASPNSGSSE